MFFTRLARIIAWIAFLLGVLRILMGFAIASGFVGPYEEALARYTTETSSGEVINQGFVYLLFGVALGTLAEIGFLLRKTPPNA